MVTATKKNSPVSPVKLPPNASIRRATAAIQSRWTPEERQWRGRLAEARQSWLLRWSGLVQV